jgi:PAS domain S-box-containing protein
LLLKSMRGRRLSFFCRYCAAAILPVVAVLVIRLVLWRIGGLLFALAVMIAAWAGGWRSGLLATALSAVLSALFLTAPVRSFQILRITEPSEGVELGLFILIGIVVTFFASRLKSAKQAAEKTAKQNTEILESIQDGFMALDSELRFTYVNQAAEILQPTPKAELLGKSFWEVHPGELGTSVEKSFRTVLAERTPLHFEHYNPALNRWSDISVYPATGGGLSVFFRDITGRKQDEEALSRLAAIVESSDDAISSLDLKGTILTWNPGAERVYGYTAEEIVGRNVRMLVPPDLLHETELWLEGLQQGGVLRLETVRVRKDGKRIQILLTASPIRDSSGAIVAVSGIIRDITERKALEEQLRQTAKLESLGVLAGGIAHDFNNLLVGILGNASMAGDILPAVSPVRPMLDGVIRASERAANLTRQLLAYSGQGRFIIEPVDISDVAREMVGLIRTSIPKAAQLRLELADSLPPVIADVTQIQQLIMNLVINGAEAIGDHPGVVTVTTGAQNLDGQPPGASAGADEIAPGQYVSLEVRDDGAGMDEATIGKIFDPFFTTKFTGRGLGLSAALGIVRGHKGTIRVASSPGRGSSFQVLLPAAGEQAPPRVVPEPRQDLIGREVVLIVDDEEIVRRTASLALERLGYKVVVASDGSEAVELFQRLSSQIALVILDLSMPTMSGEECLKKLKGIRPDIPVLLSSGFNEAEAVRRFQASGVAGFLQKPYTARRLAETVKATLEGVEHDS